MRRKTIGKVAGLALAGMLLCAPLTGCLVAGYTSEGGWWVWPGSLAITLVLLLVLLLSRR
jgi:hypothetical protein